MSGKGRVLQNPKDYISCGIPVNDTARLQAVAVDRGATIQSVIREAVDEWIQNHPHELESA